MDPITHAMHQLGDDAEAFWSAHPQRALPLLAQEDQREEVVVALRMLESRPENRRPLVVFRAPFEGPSSYFSALAAQVAADYEHVRAGAAEEGVALPPFAAGDDGTVPSSALKRTLLAMNRAAHLLGEPFAGLMVALVPHHVADVDGWRDGVQMLGSVRCAPRVRVAIFDPIRSTHAKVLDEEGAHFRLKPDELREFLAQIESRESAPSGTAPKGASPPDDADGGAKLRRLMLEGSARMADGQPAEAATLFEAARALCVAKGLAYAEVGVLMALAGAWVAAHVPELAVESFSKAAGLAEQAGEWSTACHAWLGVGGANLAHERWAPAAVAYRSAADAARSANVPILSIDCLRMLGTCFLRAGNEAAAIVVWREAIRIGMRVDGQERATSAFHEVAVVLEELLERRGQEAEATSVSAIVKP